MATAMTLRKFLESHDVPCEIMSHAHTATALESAVAAHVDADSMAKAVVVGDERGLMLAVVPASHLLKIKRLREATGRRLHLITEREFAARFPDCEIGAIPALGKPYGMEMIWDDCLAENSEIYFEAGDHESLMHMACKDFVDLVGDSQHGRISVHR